jgi:hypothetical protein
VAPSGAGSAKATSLYGKLRIPASPVSHRVFLGTRVVGSTGDTISVRCDIPYFLRIGSQGRVQVVRVPCDGELVAEPKW